jgi:hypothetical protein
MQLVRNNERATDSPMIDVTLHVELGNFQSFGDGQEYFQTNKPVFLVSVYMTCCTCERGASFLVTGPLRVDRVAVLNN